MKTNANKSQFVFFDKKSWYICRINGFNVKSAGAIVLLRNITDSKLIVKQRINWILKVACHKFSSLKRLRIYRTFITSKILTNITLSLTANQICSPLHVFRNIRITIFSSFFGK